MDKEKFESACYTAKNAVRYAYASAKYVLGSSIEFLYDISDPFMPDLSCDNGRDIADNLKLELLIIDDIRTGRKW